MKVSEAMTREILIARPDHTIEQAARAMVELDAGVLPVAEEDRLVGMITDRDIAVRAVAVGKGVDTPVREVMSSNVKCSPVACARSREAPGRHSLAR